jgi:Mn-dependent DtxR family transcriptional regulator
MKVDEKELNRLRKIGENMNVSKRTVKIWEKNLKQGYRFFQPHNAIQLTPRTEREANAIKNLRKQMREVQKSR